MLQYTSVEICAGAGGQALGLHNAGFSHRVLIEIESAACETLRLNNHHHSLGWGTIIEGCVKHFAENEADNYSGVDLVAGGVPCPPFSKAGKQLGKDDERDLFPTALKIVNTIRPKAVMLENVAGLLDPKFKPYREQLDQAFSEMGYKTFWKLFHASDYGVPQLRPRVLLVALRSEYAEYFHWPTETVTPPTVGDALFDLMSINGWEGAKEWSKKADRIAPTLVGGSHKHGGPDLGPTRAKRSWQDLGINGHSIADNEPDKGFIGYIGRDGKIRVGFENMPRLTVRMAARIQGFPDWWEFSGKKTAAYRQVGNAFPPPVAEAAGRQIRKALETVDFLKKEQLALQLKTNKVQSLRIA
ncbi:DNA cytosine methyltransferase [Enterobacteriaceae bacterium H11S18]|uniref:DNA cytosine methyltransferase n=1 Tax=Dryocola clanedunensis TaxID=2925396 RepID=UPI0022F0FC94|nr:DNA cytosine methyltransferase [Dryocola clanedunensis]MCT4710732.1 DNA cytosine methyltransferase [Dryocola clanedunensis]